MILNAENLSFQYNSIDILKDVNFSIHRGEITVILGPNGVGKTTLLKCLNRILSPREGEVRIKDKNIKQMTVKQIAREISYMAQKNETAKVTVFDAILMGRLPHIVYRTRARDLEKVDAVMQQLNLTHMRLKYIDQLSGGELQKVSIARALVQQTDLLLLDEPTSSLDLKNQTQILALLKHIVRNHKIAAVMTMHDLNAALRYADQYICLKDNTIYDAGKIKDICPEIVTNVYGLAVEIVYHQGHPFVVPTDNGKAA